MKSIKEISSTDVFQRRILFINAFFTYAIAMFLLADSAFILYYVDVYSNAVRSIAIAGFLSFMIGNLLGGLLLKKSSTGRVFIVADSLFVMISVIMLLKNAIIDYVPAISMITDERYYFLLAPLFSIVAFFTGVKSNYFLKITCGNFIDDKKGVIPFVLTMLAGSLTGMTFFSVVTLLGKYQFLGALMTVPIIPTIFIIRFTYNHPPRYAQETVDPQEVSQEAGEEKEDVYFAFMNFSFITIYVYLGYLFTVKSYGNLYPVQMLFFAVVSSSVLAGYLITRIFRNAFWFIYSEMLFPIVFLGFVFAV